MAHGSPRRPRPVLPRFSFLLSFLLLTTLLAACGEASPTEAEDPEPPPAGVDGIQLAQVASGLSLPLDLTAPPGDARLFVAEQGGRILIIRDGELLSEPFLDLRDRTTAQGERGLLGFTFHPDHASNGRFFVHYTDLSGDGRLVEFRVGADPDRADPASGAELLRIPQPFGNHNGGHLEFGPDGMLYLGMGDGGSGGDPLGHGQDVGSILGGLIRLDVETAGTARIPSDNPFAGQPEDGREELWAWGLRNPWRFSFDPEGGHLYVADVGQNRWEEVNVVPADAPGLNYGWAVMEGPECFQAASCDPTGLVEPVLAYRTNQDGCAVIGGYVYRGDAIPAVRGHYLFSDFCAGWLRSFRFDGEEAVDHTEWPIQGVGRVLAMGRDAAGEIYVLSQAGGVYRIEPAGE